MKIAIIDACWKQINSKNPLGEALGGSETWLIQIATEFAKNADVDVYCNCTETRKHKGVNYIKESFFNTKEKYDFIILNRVFKVNQKNYIQYIVENNLAKRIYLQMHDLSLNDKGRIITNDMDLDGMFLNHPRLTLVTLNEWHNRNTKRQYPALLGDILCIPNGVDLDLFPKEENTNRDNRILWSSCMNRGAQILISDIYPLVKKEISDFGIDIACYNDDHQVTDLEGKDVRFIGKLQKQALYHEMQKHKVWFYPGTFAETFCITLIENVLNGAKVVSPLTYGTGSTIFEPEKFKMKYDFDHNYYEAVKEAAQMIINILKQPYTKEEKYESIKEKIRTTYNWKYSVDQYLTHFDKYKQDKKILILSMSCNQVYFKGLLGAVKDTWVKPILQGKYPNIEWFSFTACDKKHPVPCIDLKDRMIYVDDEDDYYTTYSKTQKAYEMIKEAGIEFDYVVRTNTSVFVNIERLLKTIYETPDDTILGNIGGFYAQYPDGHKVFKWNFVPGFFIGMNKQLFETSLTADNDYCGFKSADDVIISGKLQEKGLFKVIKNFENYRYKPCQDYYKPEEYALKLKDLLDWGCKLTDDPSIINNQVVVQFRTIYEGIDRQEKGHEIEHLYELNDALI